MIPCPPVDDYELMFAGQPGLMTAKQVAGVLGFAEKTIFAWARSGRIPCKYYNGLPRFMRSEMIEWARTGGPARRQSPRKALVK